MATTARRSPRNHPTSNPSPSTSTSHSTPTLTRHLSSSSSTSNKNSGSVSMGMGRGRISVSPKEGRMGDYPGGGGSYGGSGMNVGMGMGMAMATAMGMGIGSSSGSGSVGGGGGGSVNMAPTASSSSTSTVASGSGHIDHTTTGPVPIPTPMSASPSTSSSKLVPPHTHHYSPYHTRSTPLPTASGSGSGSGSGNTSMTGSGSTGGGSSPALLSPSGSGSGGVVGLRENIGGGGCSNIESGLENTPSRTPTQSRRGGINLAYPTSSKSPEREFDSTFANLTGAGGGTQKHRAGLTVEGIMMQSGSGSGTAGGVGEKGLGGVGGMGGMNTRSGKGKGRSVDYGDRFIPQRSTNDLHAAYTLLPDGPDALTGFVPSGINGEAMTAAVNARRAEAERSRRRAMMGEGEGMREEANRSYANLMKSELFGPAATDRPMPCHTSSAPNLPVRSGGNVSASSHLHHPSSHSNGEHSLPPLPSHAPSAPAPNTVGAFATASTRSPYSGNNTNIIGEPPVTPSKKRVFEFSSPTAPTKASPSSRLGGAKNSPGNIGLGYQSATGVGMGLDDMMHEKYSLSPMGKKSQRFLLSPRRPVRYMSKTPFKVLDAPELADDFYLNLVSWASSNILAVGLRGCVYLWSAQTASVTKLCDFSETEGNQNSPPDEVTGLEWTNRGSTIAIGTQRGTVEIWDAETCTKLRTMSGHTARVGTLAWNEHILTTGSRDRTILHRDTRMREHHFKTLKTHRQEVCGLKWNQATNQLASGGNDNKLYVWDGLNDQPLYRFTEHCAAVKAIAWSPHQKGLLATGGGTADKKVRFWNTLTGGLLSEWDTGSQVCNLMWSKNSNEIVSTHGYSGGAVSNQICVWKYPTMSPVATLTGHTYRVLYLAMSPDGQTIVTGAGDETLRFWNAFEKGRCGEAPRDEMSSEDAIRDLQERRREDSDLNPFSRIR